MDVKVRNYHNFCDSSLLFCRVASIGTGSDLKSDIPQGYGGSNPSHGVIGSLGPMVKTSDCKSLDAGSIPAGNSLG